MKIYTFTQKQSFGTMKLPSADMATSLTKYIAEIRLIPLLTREAEIALAKEIKAGTTKIPKNGAKPKMAKEAEVTDTFSASKSIENSNLPNDTAKEDGIPENWMEEDDVEYILTPKAKKAADKLAESNLRLVVGNAKRYINKGVALSDLIQEGNIGLMKAAVRFDPDRGFKFSTYATCWIKQCISRHLSDKSRTIRIPVHKIELMRKVARSGSVLEYKLTRKPTEGELAEITGLKVDALRDVQELLSTKTVSLDLPIGQDKNHVLADVIPNNDGSFPSALNELETENLNSCVCSALSQLSPKEVDIIKTRFGIDVEMRTLDEVGKKYNLSRERIRQIQIRALQKIKNSPVGKILKEYLTD